MTIVGLCPVTDTGVVTIMGGPDADVPVTMHNAAFTLTDVSPLYLPADQRGDDRVVEGVPGTEPMPRRTTITKHNLDMTACGEIDPDTGLARATGFPSWEWDLLLEWLDLMLCSTPTTPTGLRAATLAPPPGATGPTKAANIRVLPVVVKTKTEGQDQLTGSYGVGGTLTFRIELPEPPNRFA